MKLCANNGYIDITFSSFAKDSLCRTDILIDEDNSVEISFCFNLDGEWGVGGDEYFLTSDISKLCDDCFDVLYGKKEHFEVIGAFPYDISCDDLDYYYRFEVEKIDSNYSVTLKIYDGLWEYITVTEVMALSRFEEICEEFKRAKQKFPIQHTQK